MSGFRSTFTRLNVYDDFFAVMYDGRKMYQQELSLVKNKPAILIFDWNGNPIAKLNLPCSADVFDLDIKNMILFTLDRENEIIRKYDISKVEKEVITSNLGHLPV